MTKIIKYSGILMLCFASLQAFAFEKEEFIRLADATIKEANSGFIANINYLISVQEKLVKLGVEGSKEYVKANPQHADILNEVIANAEIMKRMTLDEIEDQWHSGKHMRSKGFDLDKFDHFGDLYSLMDSIIHPATSYIALNEYKRTRKADMLSRASAELIEVVEHVKNVSGSDTKLTEN